MIGVGEIITVALQLLLEATKSSTTEAALLRAAMPRKWPLEQFERAHRTLLEFGFTPAAPHRCFLELSAERGVYAEVIEKHGHVVAGLGDLMAKSSTTMPIRSLVDVNSVLATLAEREDCLCDVIVCTRAGLPATSMSADEAARLFSAASRLLDESGSMLLVFPRAPAGASEGQLTRTDLHHAIDAAGLTIEGEFQYGDEMKFHVRRALHGNV